MLLLCLNAGKVTGEEYTKNIETVEANIKFDQTELPPVAYLYIELKNNGDKNVSNLTFEISYYDAMGYLIKKSVVKNALTESMPKGKARKYKVRLNGDVVNLDHEQYPYSRHDKVNDFDIKIINVKFGSK